jgi:type VI secretion system protein ImpA
VLRPLRELPLASSPQTGPITWRDIAVFQGQLEPDPGREKHNEALIRDAFNKTDRGRLQTLRSSIDLAFQQVSAIAATFEAKTGLDLDLDGITKLLDEIRKDLKRFEPVVVEAEPDEVATELEADAEAPMQMPSGAAPASQSANPRRPMSVRSITAVSEREDALYLLELVAAYFRVHEPSSPAPLLIDRARRLATMDFIDILRDLAPDGMSQAQIVAGQVPD